jgi:hypothetical protein
LYALDSFEIIANFIFLSVSIRQRSSLENSNVYFKSE